MNNLDYLEYEGSRLLDYAMKTYSKTSTGSLVNDIERAVLAGQKELSLAEQDALQCQAFLKMSRKKHFISPIFRGLKEGKSKAKSKNAFYRSSFNVSLL